MTKKLFLLDAMALIFRAYYAMIKSPRRTSKGVNTSAILGFTNTLYELLKNEKPTHIAVSFDTGAPTVRHIDYEAYKAHRQATPEDIVNSVPYIKKILDAFNIPILQMDGYEADDVIGTAAKKAEIEGFEIYMMTSDKDYGQLVSENIRIYKPGKFGQKAEIIGVSEVCHKYSIQRPEQLTDILGLWGDSSDNIPGVPNVGEVKAKKLIAQFDTIDNIYIHIDEIENDKLRQTLIDNKEQAELSKMLATIIIDVPIELDFEKMAYLGPDVNKLKTIFYELEFQTLAKRIFTDLSLSADSKKANPATPDLFSVIQDRDTPGSDPSTIFNYKTFNDVKHDFHEIFSADDLIKVTEFLTDGSLFFDWILLEDKIAGFCLSFEKGKVYYHFLEDKDRNYKQIFQFLFCNERKIVTWQCKQSYKLLKNRNIEYKATFCDLQIAHYLIQPEIAHQLDRISENYLNYSLLTDSKRNSREDLLNLCGEKIEVYRQLYPIFMGYLEKDKLTNLFFEIEMPLAEVLADMEYIGVKVDEVVLKENADTISQELEKLEKEVYEIAGVTFNIASPKQLGEVLFDKLKIIENAKLTKTKQYQTGEEVLAKLAGKHPIVSMILEWRSLSKLKTTYIDALPNLINPKTGRIHTTFNQTVTSTGRLSSANPNLQNIPIRTALGRDIRKAFVSSDENLVILSADYSQIELRIVASICGDTQMLEAFEKGEDIHSMMASKVYKVPISEVTATMRRNAKTVNFGILYGMSAFGLADRLQIPQREARELIESYFKNFPKINQFLDDTLAFARENGYVETLLGRRRYIKEINSRNGILKKAAERNAINAPVQGTAADLIKIAMVQIYQTFRKEKLKSVMIMQVHDELVFEVWKNELEIVKKIVSDQMIHAMELATPLAIEMNYGKNWYEAH